MATFVLPVALALQPHPVHSFLLAQDRRQQMDRAIFLLRPFRRESIWSSARSQASSSGSAGSVLVGDGPGSRVPVGALDLGGCTPPGGEKKT